MQPTPRETYLAKLRQQMEDAQRILDEHPEDADTAMFLQLTKKHYDAMMAQDAN